MITDDTIEYVSMLAGLELSKEEKIRAKEDMERMLRYMDKLKQLDTEEARPLTQVFPVTNVFREDVVTNGNNREEILANAPEKTEGAFVVPKTVGS